MKRYITYLGAGVAFIAFVALAVFVSLGSEAPMRPLVGAVEEGDASEAARLAGAMDPISATNIDAAQLVADAGDMTPDEDDLEVIPVDLQGEPVEARVVLGAAGVYPPVAALATVEAPARLRWELAETFDGEPIDQAELRVVSQGPPLQAFWGMVSLADADDSGRIVVEVEEASPLDVVVVRAADGVPVADATLRLARGELGLLSVSQKSDAAGELSFPAMPPGDFVISVEAAGFLRAVEPVRAPLSSPGAPLVVALERGRAVAGRVVTAHGAAVPGALVAIHVSTGGSEGDAVPYALLESDLLGHFRVDGLPPGTTWALAQHPGFSPSSSPRVDTRFFDTGLVGSSVDATTELEVRLAPGRNVRVRVVEATGDPVPRALVRWRDDDSGMGAARATGEDGTVEFTEIPGDASFVASQGEWTSPVSRVALAALQQAAGGGDDFAELTLTLRREGAYADLRVRLLPAAADVEIRELRAIGEGGEGGEGGASCEGIPSGDDPRDWILASCPRGSASLSVRSAEHGAVRFDVELDDGVSVRLPEPTPVQVRLKGQEGEPWPATQARWTDGIGWHAAPLEPVDDTTRRWTAALYPGTYTLEVDNPRIATQQAQVTVGGDPITQTLELASRQRIDVFALDERGAPLTGAQVFLLVDGRIAAQARSAGQLPVQERVRPPAEVIAVVVDPRRGEGVERVRVTQAGEPVELQVRAQAPVGSTSLPGRLSRAEVEELLEVDLVAEGQGWQLDFSDPQAKASQAGLSRGDFLVAAWRAPRGVRLLTWSASGGYSEAVLQE